jgi:hypothetical protein
MKRWMIFGLILVFVVALAASAFADPIHVGGGPKVRTAPIHVGGGPKLANSPIHVGGGVTLTSTPIHVGGGPLAE